MPDETIAHSGSGTSDVSRVTKTLTRQELYEMVWQVRILANVTDDSGD